MKIQQDVRLIANLADLVDTAINKERPRCGFILTIFEEEDPGRPIYVSNLEHRHDIRGVMMAQLAILDDQVHGTMDADGNVTLDAKTAPAAKPTPKEE